MKERIVRKLAMLNTDGQQVLTVYQFEQRRVKVWNTVYLAEKIKKK